MAIETNNLVIYGSQRNTDTDDGGGQYNGEKVEGGYSNNVFDDTSMLDRAMGDVSNSFCSDSFANSIPLYSSCCILLCRPDFIIILLGWYALRFA